MVRLVFTDLLVLADRHGEVDMTASAIARRTNVPLEVVQRSLVKLSEPDPDSRTPGDDGRRIVLLDEHRSWGWRIVNFVTYNAMRDEDARRNYFRERKAQQRAKAKAETQNEEDKPNCPGHSTTVNLIPPTHTQTHTKTDVSKKPTASSHPGETGDGLVKPDGKHPDLLIYEAYPRHEGRGDGLKAIAKAVKRLTKGEAPLGPMDATTARRLLWKMATMYAQSPAGRNADRTKVPHPATWFNQSRYLDDQTNWQHTGDPHARQHHAAHQSPQRADRTLSAAARAIQAIENRASTGEDGDTPQSE